MLWITPVVAERTVSASTSARSARSCASACSTRASAAETFARASAEARAQLRALNAHIVAILFRGDHRLSILHVGNQAAIVQCFERLRLERALLHLRLRVVENRLLGKLLGLRLLLRAGDGRPGRRRAGLARRSLRRPRPGSAFGRRSCRGNGAAGLDEELMTTPLWVALTTRTRSGVNVPCAPMERTSALAGRRR